MSIHCFRRKITGTFLSVQSNRVKPAILAFRNIDNARNMKRFYYQLENPKQDVVISTFTEESLVKMCQDVHLDIEIIDESKLISLDAPTSKANCINILDRAFSMSMSMPT